MRVFLSTVHIVPPTMSVSTIKFKKPIWVFHTILQKNPNKSFGQPNIILLTGSTNAISRAPEPHGAIGYGPGWYILGTKCFQCEHRRHRDVLLRVWESERPILKSWFLCIQFGTLGRSLKPSGPQFPHLRNGDNDDSYLPGW